jgi:DNA uptake protein ComE-like DNA-binding protein
VVQYRTDKGAIKSFEELAKVPGLRAEVLAEQKKNIVY